MNIILKSAKVINVESKHNGTKQDILISEGKIKKIGNSISEKNAKIIDVKNLHVWACTSSCPNINPGRARSPTGGGRLRA